MSTLRLAAITFTTSALVGLAAVGHATIYTANGVVSYFGPVGGYNYKDYNQIEVDNPSGPARAWTFLAKNGGGSIPAGYMGARPRLFKGSTICKQNSTATFNTASAVGIGISTVPPSCGTGSYHSDGFSYQWDGNSYVEHDAKISPSLNLT